MDNFVLAGAIFRGGSAVHFNARGVYTRLQNM